MFDLGDDFVYVCFVFEVGEDVGVYFIFSFVLCLCVGIYYV